MADSAHWIVVPHNGGEAYETTQATVLDNFSALRPITHLVPGRVWRDYQQLHEQMVKVTGELRSYSRPELTLCAPHAPGAR